MLPIITPSTQTLSFGVSVTNNTPDTAYVACYIDFNRDGDFIDTGERSNVVVAIDPVVQVNFSGFDPPIVGSSYLRCRLATSDPSQVTTPTGVADSGEVEDYPVSITDPLAVTLSYAFAERLDDGRSSSSGRRPQRRRMPASISTWSWPTAASCS